jgi:type IV fimbrial biogenesis protein FimT
MNKRNGGFTLVELMVILVLIGMSMTVAVPSFQSMIARNTIITQTNEVILAINLARSEATRTGGLVSLSAAASASGNEFGGGFCVVLGTPTDCANGNVVRQFDAFKGSVTLASVEDVDIVQFNNMGGLSSAGPTTINFDLCHSKYQGRRIQISIVGRVKSHVQALSSTSESDTPFIQPACAPVSS